jgi:hypothetical protein
MSEMDGTISLLGHDDKLATQRWQEDNAAHPFFKGGRFRTPAFLMTLLFIPLTIFFVLYTQKLSPSQVPEVKLAGHLVPITKPSPHRDLKLLLHPEDHVSRDPVNIHFSWNITKAIIAPNGVRKDVFLINSKTNYNIAL